MKKIVSLIMCFAIMLNLAACSEWLLGRSDFFGFSKRDFTVMEEVNNHGGFHGDGSYYIIMDCSKNKEKALEILSDWKKLPMTENLNRIMFKYENDGMNLAEEAKIPMVKNGYYFFYDRHSESADSSDDSEIFGRGSYNFSLAIYDSDTDMMYYYEYDT